ncbi:hypothetical protein [Stutzerimonas stutzeri]|uniref:hypothetical protein n=1 Tax=Stutzerimonas stutzeri TaxID=316 RepID=UPI00265CE6A5|nr:hypothetical protein [Stutzerimonas stutzeri]MCF6783366.1 hypothetical protein [Stutzerimonas stutzeri]
MILTGCATSGSKYVHLQPHEAVAAIALEHDPEATSLSLGEGMMQDSVTLKRLALADTIKDVEAYCAKRPGKVSYWPGVPRAFNCISPSGKIDFATIVEEKSFTLVAQIKVVERKPENDMTFDFYLSALGYRTPEQIMADQRKRMAEAREERRKAEEAQLAQRKQNRDQVAYVGARVCQRVPHSMGSEAILIGTVEQVLGDRIKVFVERAVIAGAPGLSPGGFRQHYTSVLYWDVEPCQ